MPEQIGIERRLYIIESDFYTGATGRYGSENPQLRQEFFTYAQRAEFIARFERLKADDFRRDNVRTFVVDYGAGEITEKMTEIKLAI